MMGIPLIAVGLSLLAPAAVLRGQDTAPSLQAAAPQEEKKRSQDLERRVAELEQQMDKVGRDEGIRWYDRLKILVFNDVTMELVDRDDRHADGDDSSTLVVGQLDLTLTADLPERFSFLAEIVIEADDTNSTVVDPERILLQYLYADELTLGAGRFHTALGHWNTAYHHGRYLFASVSRPSFYEFEDEGGLLPVHFVGLDARGKVQVPGGTLLYEAHVGNGRGKIADEVQMAVDSNTDKAILGNVGFEPADVAALRFGGSVWLDKIPQDLTTPGRDEEVREVILGAYAVYAPHPVEVMTEFFRMIHTGEDTGNEYHFSMVYAQVAIQLGQFKPYYRMEFVDGPVDSLDPYFGTQVTRYSEHVLGVGWSPLPFLVFKVEVGTKEGAGSSADEDWLAIQTAFGF